MIRTSNIQKTKERVKSNLHEIKGIRGVGISRNQSGHLCVLVNVSPSLSEKEIGIIRKKAETRRLIIKKIGEPQFVDK